MAVEPGVGPISQWRFVHPWDERENRLSGETRYDKTARHGVGPYTRTTDATGSPDEVIRDTRIEATMPWRDLPVRRHTRLPGWDYRSPGPYAVTLCTQHREWFFGDVTDGRVIYNAAGKMIVAVWREMATEFSRVLLDAFVVMPNHLHAIVHLSREGPADNPTLGDVVQRFKSITTARYSAGVHDLGWERYDRRLWQWDYYEHIVRDRSDLERCRRYIAANPANWKADRDRDPDRSSPTP